MAKRLTRVLLNTLFLALFMPFLLVRSGYSAETNQASPTHISLWVYPIGEFSDPDTVKSFIAAFNRQYPDISVTVEHLDYDTGDIRVSAAISAGTAPDVVMEGPERLVSNWGAKGVMVDLSDLWTEEVQRDISAAGGSIAGACRTSEGIYYEYPLCRTIHCMAINYEVFEKAGALRYLNLADRTWTTEDFIRACKAVAASGLVKTPGIVYSGGQGGDQGTRALVSNLYGAGFTNAAHTAYTINSPEGIRALTTLRSMVEDGLLTSDADIQAKEELSLFSRGVTAMSFAWNSSNERNYAVRVKFTPYAMAFPTDQAAPSLCPGIWGFGIFNNGDRARIAAAKKLIRFLCDDPEQGRKSVRATKFFPVRASFSNAYDGTEDAEQVADYRGLLRYSGDYANITPGWAAQRTVWWNLLQKVFSGTNPQEAADWYARVANQAIRRAGQSPVHAISAQPTKRALFISSYSLNDPTVKEQIEGLEEGLGSDVYLHFEFMDSTAISNQDYVAAFYNYIRYKYAHLYGLGAIIVGDDNALQMVIRYQNGIFRDIPVVYESVSSQVLTELADSLGMTGIRARDTIADNLDLARRVWPKAKAILAISDDSAVGSALTAHLEAVKSRYAPMPVEILNTSVSTADEITRRIEQAADSTILLYMSFTADADGKSYLGRESLELVTGHAAAPVFTLSWLGRGSLGGIAADAKETGRYAGQITNGFLSGKLADARIAGSRASAKPAIDATVMERFGLIPDVFPPDTVFHNKKPENTRFLLIIEALAAGVVLLAALLLWLGRENRRRKANEGHLRKTSDILRAQAEHDELTGLENRRVFEREIRRSVHANRRFTLFILDLDDFKKINDTCGHPGGDEVLRETGRRLATLKSRAFVPYRYGGDEFAIMTFGDQPEALEVVVQRLLHLFEQKFTLDSGEIQVRISIGGAAFPSDAVTPEELVCCADHALYDAKMSGKDTVRQFNKPEKQ